MKKTIAIIAAVVVVIAAAVGIYFGFFAGDDTPAEIEIYKDSFTLSDSTVDTYLAAPERYRNSLSASYGLGDELADSFFAEPENWLAFDLILDLKNVSEKSLTVIGFKINNNGKNDVYASTGLGGQLNLSPRAAYPVSLSILCNNGDLSLAEAEKLVDELDVELIYADTVDENADITETKLASINEE